MSKISSAYGFFNVYWNMCAVDIRRATIYSRKKMSRVPGFRWSTEEVDDSTITAVVAFVKKRDARNRTMVAADEDDVGGDEEDEDADLQVSEEYQQLAAALARVDVKTRDVREKFVKEKRECEGKVADDDDVEMIFRVGGK